jgi:hypothetical protein
MISGKAGIKIETYYFQHSQIGTFGTTGLELAPSLCPASVDSGDAMEHLDKVALNVLQPPEFRNKSSSGSTLKTLLFFTAVTIDYGSHWLVFHN